MRKVGKIFLFIFFILLVSYIYILIGQLKNTKKQIFLYKQQIAEMKTQKPGEFIYKDPQNEFYIRIPYGYEIEKTEYWTAIKMKRPKDFIGGNIVFGYDNKSASDRKKSESYLSYIKRTTYPFLDHPAQPTYKDVSYQGREAVLGECNHATSKGGGITCDNNGNQFWRNLHISDGKNGEFGFDIESERDAPMHNVDLTQWIDRVFFIEK